MSSSAVPVMFTLPPSNRHEIILVDPSEVKGLKALNKQLMATIQSSPNCAECTLSSSVPLPPTIPSYSTLPAFQPVDTTHKRVEAVCQN